MHFYRPVPSASLWMTIALLLARYAGSGTIFCFL